MPRTHEAVPIITANYRPLRFVARGPLDQWAPTLEEINSREYDYVKLHRMSTYVDVGIAPYSMGVCFDGTLVLPATPALRERESSLALFNRTLAELLVGGIYCEAVTPDDVGYGSLSFTGYVRMHGGAGGDAATFHRAARSKHIGTLDVISLLNPESIAVDDLQASVARGRELLQRLGEIPREQLLYGATFYVRKQWAESLINIWTTTERLVEIAWQKYVVVAFGKPSKGRRAFLDDHRTWPVSAKLEVLLQKGMLPVSVLDTLDRVRKARNDFAHRGAMPDHAVATSALDGCFQLASLCASNFTSTTEFSEVTSLIQARCKPRLYPEKTKFSESEVSHWLPLPPLPGDKEWGDKPFEVLEDLVLKPVRDGA
ncbi:hypothetical protein [Roseateles paludis]|jgi:hypothetical protein|uniref:Apea-like HEPN domain-containing protein n=1 Tax=Roseateles paludis TaxID=3145238 RepID=A0ABV0FYJ5_9BURK